MLGSISVKSFKQSILGLKTLVSVWLSWHAFSVVSSFNCIIQFVADACAYFFCSDTTAVLLTERHSSIEFVLVFYLSVLVTLSSPRLL